MLIYKSKIYKKIKNFNKYSLIYISNIHHNLSLKIVILYRYRKIYTCTKSIVIKILILKIYREYFTLYYQND